VWWQLVVGAIVGLIGGVVLLWLALLLLLWRGRSQASSAREALRLMPDVLRLISRLARDSSLPRGVRVRLWFLAAYLASPIDLVPDVIPVVGFADDAVLIALVLRSVVKRAGIEPVRKNWPGTPEGLVVVSRLAGLGR
jgi:uncharacterized membrane protein YkvA (DUF1232 family)